jgi:hypothetical protein
MGMLSSAIKIRVIAAPLVRQHKNLRDQYWCCCESAKPLERGAAELLCLVPFRAKQSESLKGRQELRSVLL